MNMNPILNLFPFYPLFQANGSTISNWLSLAIWILIIAIVVWSGFPLFQKKKRLLKKLENLNNAITKYTAEDKIGNRRELSNNIEHSLPEFKHCWKEYDKTLVEVTRKTGDKQLHNTADASCYFNESTLASGLVDNRMISAVPGFLTGLGLLGTFLGLAIGLNGLDLSATESGKLISGIAVVINGAQLAFSTSVWGILASLIFSWCEKIFIEKPVREKILQLQEFIDKAFPRITAEGKLSELSDSSEQSREILSGLAERIGNEFQKSMEQVSKDMVGAIRTGLGEIRESTTGQNGEVLGTLLQEFISKFQDIAEKPGQEMLAAADATKEALSLLAGETTRFIADLRITMQEQATRDEQRNNTLVSVVRAIEEQSTNASRELRLATEALIERLNGVTTEVAEKMTKESVVRQQVFESSTTQLATLMREQTEKIKSLIELNSETIQESGILLSSLKEVANSVNSSFNSLESATLSMSSASNLIQSTGTTLSTAVSTAATEIAQFGDIHQIVRTQFDASALELRKNLLTFKSVIDQFEELPAKVKTEHKEYLDGLNTEFSKALSNYAKEVSAQTNSRMDAWNEQTIAFVTTMTDVVGTIKEAVEDFTEQLETTRGTK